MVQRSEDSGKQSLKGKENGDLKVCAFQPGYPFKREEMTEYLQFLEKQLDACTEDLDLIVLPECCNAPLHYENRAAFQADADPIGAFLQKKAAETAIRCKALVCINLYCPYEDKYRNTTLLFGRDGQLAARYEKQHLPRTELAGGWVDSSYTQSFRPVPMAVIDGIRFGFLTCYDNYYHEYVARMAEMKLDIILAPGYQRGEKKEIIQGEMQDIAFNCNAVVIRSSVSMGNEDCPVGGQTMIVNRDGTIRKNLNQKIGVLLEDIALQSPYMRIGGFGGHMVRNEAFISEGRTPWAYRACGACVKPGDDTYPWPRKSVRDGIRDMAPACTLPAFALAVSMGMDEIEVDTRLSRDGIPVVSFSDFVEEHSGNVIRISSSSWADLSQACLPWPAASQYVSAFHLIRPEDLFHAFPRQIIMGIHCVGWKEKHLSELLEAARTYDCAEHIYLIVDKDTAKESMQAGIPLHCCLEAESASAEAVYLAKQLLCTKVCMPATDTDTQRGILEIAKEEKVQCYFRGTDNGLLPGEYGIMDASMTEKATVV